MLCARHPLTESHLRLKIAIQHRKDLLVEVRNRIALVPRRVNMRVVGLRPRGGDVELERIGWVRLRRERNIGL